MNAPMTLITLAVVAIINTGMLLDFLRRQHNRPEDFVILIVTEFMLLMWVITGSTVDIIRAIKNEK